MLYLYMLLDALSVLSKFVIFRCTPVKMCHLSAGGFVCMCAPAYMSFDALSVYCQDVSSFGMHLSRCVIFWVGALYVCTCTCCLMP